MAVNQLLVRSYANNIYMYGTNSYENIAAQPTRAEYVTPENNNPVMQYAADHFYLDDIDYALTKTWINQQQYADTIALKGPEDPQYRVLTLAAKEGST